MRPFTKNFAIALTSFCAFGIASAHPVAAQNLVYTLNGVTFDDGAVATGYFDYNPTTQTYGTYNITSTNGITDNLLGSNYTESVRANYGYNNDVFVIEQGTDPISTLVLDTLIPATRPGVFALYSGIRNPDGGFQGSGELTPSNIGRVLTSGSLIVTPAAVPEASTVVSFGLLLALGAGGFITARKKATASV